MAGEVITVEYKKHKCGKNQKAIVTVGNSPTASGTLGSYQTLDWARLVCRGYHNREEPYLPFNTQHLLRYNIITAHGTSYGNGT